MTQQPIYRTPLVETYIKRYYRSHMTSRVRIYRGRVESQEPVYTGPARVHLLSGAVQMGFGDEPQFMVSGTISVPQHDDAGVEVRPMVDDTVQIISTADSRDDGRSFRVMHVTNGGQFQEHVTMSVMGAEESRSATGLPAVPPGVR